MIMINNQIPLIIVFVEWVEHTVFTHYRYVEYFPRSRAILSDCFGHYPIMNSGVSGGFNVSEASIVNNHYILSSIMLPSIFIACCWIMMSYVVSFFKRTFDLK